MAPIKAIISQHAAGRAAERGFPAGFLAVAEAAATALYHDLMDALNKACSMHAVGGKFVIKSAGRRYNVDYTSGKPQVATEVVLGAHCAVVGITTACVPTVVTIKPAETQAKRLLKAERRKMFFREVEA